MDDNLNFTQTIEAQFAHDGLETAIATAVKQVFAENLATQMQDLVDYGSPHIGSATVVERFTKQDGLAVLRRSDPTAKLLRIIYANWSSLASERGVDFLKFVLRMMWGDGTEVVRLWHSVANIAAYPTWVSDQQQAGYFLTSRLRISLSADVDLTETQELAPIIKKLVPAHILPIIHAKILDRNWAHDLGVAIGAKAYLIADLSDGVPRP